MQTKGTAQFSIAESLDCAVAQNAARQLTRKLGFAEPHSEEVVLAVTELASNLVRHAGHGTLILRSLNSDDRIGIEVEAEDHGPGMADIEQAFTDGYSTAGGLGYGLGTVNRLMDELEIRSTAALGTSIVCRRWLRSATARAALRTWDVGVATRSRNNAPENGDAFVVREWEGKLLAGVIDGLGHGKAAQQAALAAQMFVHSHYNLPLDGIFLGAGRACRGTRGVVMALARFESAASMRMANLGNIEVRAWTGTHPVHFSVQRGFLGMSDPHIVVRPHNWKRDWVLVLHSDGLRTRWQWNDFPGLERKPAQAIAELLLHEHATQDDDATVLTVKN